MRNKKNIRTCIGCNLKKDKKNLYRIAKIKVLKNINKKDDKNKNIIFDSSQQKGGRGVYVCSAECLDKAIQRKFLQNQLKQNISISTIEELKEAIKKD